MYTGLFPRPAHSTWAQSLQSVHCTHYPPFLVADQGDRQTMQISSSSDDDPNWSVFLALVFPVFRGLGCWSDLEFADLRHFFFCRPSLSSASAFFTGVSVKIAVFLFLLPLVLCFLGGAFGCGCTVSGENWVGERNCARAESCVCSDMVCISAE